MTKIKIIIHRLFTNKTTWLIILTAALLALLFVLWPGVECALGQCATKDQWCNSDCTQSCQPATQLGYVGSCGVNGNVCYENWYSDSVAVQCTNSDDCNVTNVIGSPNRLHWVGGSSWWKAGGCAWVGSSCSYDANENDGPVDCCTGGGGGSGGCTAKYNPPTIALGSTSPKNPIVYGQDPDKLGVAVVIDVAGGTKSNKCSNGPNQRKVTSITLNSVSLSSVSRTWITGTLAQRYPGAKVKDTYPLHPAVTTTGLNTKNASISFHYNPLDPGYYDISVTAVQDNGQTTTTGLSVPAYFLDSTITLPQP